MLETNFYWGIDFYSKKWELTVVKTDIPAPSMAEVWRELPDFVGVNKIDGDASVELTLYVGEKWAGHYETQNANPTDALIALLIFIKKT